MSAGRWLGAALAVVVLAGIALLVLLLNSLDAIVERQIEEHGSRLAGTRVALDGVDIDLTEGRGTFRGLTVANPPGFSRGDAIRLASVTLEIDLASLGGSPLHVERVEVGETEVRLEVSDTGRTNLDALRRNVESQPADAAEDPGPAESDEAPRLQISHLRFAGGEIHTQGPHTGGKERRVPFPGLAMNDLGGARGATAGAIGKEVLLAFTRRVATIVARSELLDRVDKELGGAAGAAAEAADGLLRGVFD